ncbi:MAG TPA: RNA pseudouridine synthase [Cyanobacteria bacterium UBA11049]|nr:RNA pseudouridine synthase [Cyanobacteria bacterium UBA11049]
MNQGWLYREQVKRVDAGVSVLDYYARRYRHSSREEWQERITSGQVLLNGCRVTVDTCLQPGQWLTYERPPWEEPDVPLSFDVLHEDVDLLIVAKPAGLPVLPGGGFLEHTLLRQLQRRYPQDTPVPIHRLGRGTSGLMLMARSPLARAKLSEQMRDRHIRKTYRALVGAGTMPDRFTITHPIGKIPHPVLDYVYGATPDGLFAHSECQVLKRSPSTTLLDVTILTGRPHQIRIHLAVAGYPLVGDPLYQVGGIPRIQSTVEAGKLPVPGDCGYHLHAHRLSFCHPGTGQPMNVICPAPEALN